MDEAEAAYDLSVAKLKKLSEEHPESFEYAMLLGRVKVQQAKLGIECSADGISALIRATVEYCRDLRTDFDDRPKALELLGEAIHQLAVLKSVNKEFVSAETLLNEAIALENLALAKDSNLIIAREWKAYHYTLLCEVLIGQNRLKEAQQALEQRQQIDPELRFRLDRVEAFRLGHWLNNKLKGRPQSLWHEEFRENNFGDGDHVGSGVTIDGDTVAIGAEEDNDIATDAGAVYIYVRDDRGTPDDRSDDTWLQQAKLYASDGQAGDQFGWYVELDGDRLAVCAGLDDDNGVDSGSAYIFERTGTTWTETAKIKPDDGAAGDWFSRQFDLEGNTFVVSSPRDDDVAGSVYIFQFDGSQWTQKQKLTTSTSVAGDVFGRYVQLDNGLLAVSAQRGFITAVRPGSVHLFAYDDSVGAWVETHELTASDGFIPNNFGFTCALDEGLMVVNSMDADGSKTGFVHVFVRDDNSTPNNLFDDQWVEQQKLLASDREAGDQFGRGLAIHNGTILVGTRDGDANSVPDSGSIYVFEHLDNGTPSDPFDDYWVETSEFSTNDLEAISFTRIAINEDGTLVVGDTGNRFSNGNTGSGAFHIFELFDECFDVAVDVPLEIKSPKGNQSSRTVVSSLFVDENFSIADLDIHFDISHANVADVELNLVHLDSEGVEHVVQLFSRIGGSGDDFSQTTLDNDVVGLISEGAAPFTGRFVPDGSLAIFEQQDAFGYWYLEVTDYKKPTDGMLNSWSIDFLGTPIVIVPTPGISVTPTSGLVTTEEGGQDSFDVFLDSEPLADVTIGISSSDTLEGIVDKSSLTFTLGNWDTPQTVTVSGVDDSVDDGDVAYAIITDLASSTDTDYDGLDADDVDATNVDDDTTPGNDPEVYLSLESKSIPDNQPAGANTSIDVTDVYEISTLTVTLDISHSRPSDLTVFLIGPNGDMVELFAFQGDNLVTHFDGSLVTGDWTVKAIDSKKKKTGTINSWFMTVEPN